MRLAFCLFKYFPYGGLQRDMLRLAEACVLHGHTVDIYTTQWLGEKPKELSVVIVPVRNWTNHGRLAQFAKKIKSFMSKKSYRFVVGFNKMPGLDVYYAADPCYQEKNKKKLSFFYRLMPRYRTYVAFEKAVFSVESKTRIFFLSLPQHILFEKYYHTPPDRFYRLPPGIHTQYHDVPDRAVRRQKIRQHYSLNDMKLILFVGSGFKTKGLDRALLAIHSLPAPLKAICHLFVIGQDRIAPFLQQAACLKLSDRVTFLGGRLDVKDFYCAADLLLHPAYHEVGGMVLLEALCCGLPVLTTNSCGYAPYVSEAQAGVVLSNPFFQKTLNDTLLQMLTSHQQTQWKENALSFARNADIYDMPERAVHFLEEWAA